MRCKNCGHHVEEWQNFCGNCGAKVIRNRLSPRILAEQVNKEILAIDNRLFRTFYAMFRAPEDVIVGYVNGVRRKYQDVLQFFAIALTLAGFQVFIMKNFFPEVFEYDPTFWGSLGNEAAIKDNPFFNMDPDQLNNFQAIVYIISLPLSALATYGSYILVSDRRYNLTEHFVINLYYLAQIIIVSSIVNIVLLIFNVNYLVIAFIMIIPTYVYNFYVLWRVFNDTLLVSFAKYLIVLVFNGIIYSILMIVTVLIGFLYAMIEQGAL